MATKAPSQAISRLRAGHRVGQRDAGEAAGERIADEAVDLLVPHGRDLRIGEQPVLQDLFRTQRIAAMDQGDVGRMVGQVQRFLDRGIAAADDHHFLAAIEEPVAGRAGRDALAAELFLARHAEPFGLRAGGDHQRLALVDVAAVADRAERRAGRVDLDNRVPQHARADMFGLRLHLLHQPGPLDDVAKAGIVLDVGGDGQLPAGLEPLHHDRLHAGARAIDRGGQAGRAGADDEHAGGVGRHCGPFEAGAR